MLSFVVLLLCNLVWVCYSLTEGIRCGLFDHLKNSWRNKIDFNFSKMLWFQRLLVLTSISLVMFWHVGGVALFFMVGQVLMFHPLHRLAHKCTKTRLEKSPPDGNKKTTKKKRAPWAAVGITLQVFIYIFLV